MNTVEGCCVIPIILAGGQGTRIAHLRPGIPKPVVPVLGRPFICHLFEQLAAAGFGEAVVSIGYNAEAFRAELNKAGRHPLSLHFVEESEPLGTGGAVANSVARTRLRTRSWLILNGDSFLVGAWPQVLRRSVCEQQAPLIEACILARWAEDRSASGALHLKGDRLAAFQEKCHGGPGWINAGIYLLPDTWLREIPAGVSASLERDLLPAWLAGGRSIRVLTSDDAFLDIGTPNSLAMADAFMERWKSSSLRAAFNAEPLECHKVPFQEETNELGASDQFTAPA